MRAVDGKRSDRHAPNLLSLWAYQGRLTNEGRVRGCHPGPREEPSHKRPNIDLQSVPSSYTVQLHSHGKHDNGNKHYDQNRLTTVDPSGRSI